MSRSLRNIFRAVEESRRFRGQSRPSVRGAEEDGLSYGLGVPGGLKRLDPSSGTNPEYRAIPGQPSTVKIPDLDEVGQWGRVEARPIDPIEDIARRYRTQHGMDPDGLREVPPFDEEMARKAAKAYADMPHAPGDKKVRAAYDALIEETMEQLRALKGSGIDIRYLKEGQKDPYARSPALGYKDLVENGRLVVFPTDFGFGSSAAFDPAQNPLLRGVGRVGDKPDAVANDAFRAVHDIFGHFGPGNPFFRHKGEDAAFRHHRPMFTDRALDAATPELRGQNSWLNFGPHGEANRNALGADTVFADQKTGIMPDWVKKYSLPAGISLGAFGWEGDEK